MFLIGVLQSFGMVFFLNIYFIMMRFASASYDIKPIMFSIISLIMTAMVLTLAAGPGKYAFESLKSKDSWKYAFCIIGLYVSEIFLVKYVSGTELTILSNSAVPMAIIISFIFLKRRHSTLDILGMLILTVSVFMTLNLQNSDYFMEIIKLTLLVGLFNTLLFISAETHGQSDMANREGHFRDKIRVVAFVSFLASIMFLIVAVGTSYLKTYYLPESINQYINFVPNLPDFINLPSVLFGMLVGAFIAPINRYLKWSASYKIKAENVLMILAFTPIFTLFFEWLFSIYQVLKVICTYLKANEELYYYL